MLLLSNKAFCNKISNQINTFLLTNTSESVSQSLLWETLKVTLRGEIIFHVAHSNKTRKKRLQDLSKAILKLDSDYSSDLSSELYKRRLELQPEFDLLSTGSEERLRLHSRGVAYEYGDKNSRILAHQLKRQAASWLIPQIRDSSNNIVSNPQDITRVFQSFCSSLYSSEPRK